MAKRSLAWILVFSGVCAWFAFAGPDAKPTRNNGTEKEKQKTEVAVLGVIHGSHLRSKAYSVDHVVEIVRRFRPESVFVEIPPARFAEILAVVDRKGFRTRAADVKDTTWIRAFPELYRGILPLRHEMKFEVVPVSGWSPEVNADRRSFWSGAGKSAEQMQRHAIYSRVSREFAAIRKREGGIENAAFYNSRHYADLRQLERTLWSASFDHGLGRGGEVAINRAHFGHIDKALKTRRGRRILIVYGAAHRYWFLKELEARSDVQLVDMIPYLSK